MKKGYNDDEEDTEDFGEKQKMTLSERLETALKQLVNKGLGYPDETYMTIKEVKTTLDGIEMQFLCPDKYKN